VHCRKVGKHASNCFLMFVDFFGLWLPTCIIFYQHILDSANYLHACIHQPALLLWPCLYTCFFICLETLVRMLDYLPCDQLWVSFICYVHTLAWHNFLLQNKLCSCKAELGLIARRPGYELHDVLPTLQDMKCKHALQRFTLVL
jgi:hypothetical protein